jgi:hypothetical protein
MGWSYQDWINLAKRVLPPDVVRMVWREAGLYWPRSGEWFVKGDAAEAAELIVRSAAWDECRREDRASRYYART